MVAGSRVAARSNRVTCVKVQAHKQEQRAVSAGKETESSTATELSAQAQRPPLGSQMAATANLA